MGDVTPLRPEPEPEQLGCGPWICRYPDAASAATGMRWRCPGCGTVYVMGAPKSEASWRNWAAPDGWWKLAHWWNQGPFYAAEELPNRDPDVRCADGCGEIATYRRPDPVGMCDDLVCTRHAAYPATLPEGWEQA